MSTPPHKRLPRVYDAAEFLADEETRMLYLKEGGDPQTVARSRLPIFVAVKQQVLKGSELIARAVSHTMAHRIANALNAYRPGKKGF
jgi:hypothetical protein